MADTKALRAELKRLKGEHEDYIYLRGPREKSFAEGWQKFQRAGRVLERIYAIEKELASQGQGDHS